MPPTAILPDSKYFTLDNLLKKNVPAPAKILEVGASAGDYVQFLRTKGYDAIGLDQRDYGCQNVKVGRIANLDEIMPGEIFDAIVARGVFSVSAIMMYNLQPAQQGTMRFIDALAKAKGEPSPMIEFLDGKSKGMLRALNSHLRQGGLIISVEDYVAGDVTAIGKGIAESTGYRVIELSPQPIPYVAILEKV